MTSKPLAAAVAAICVLCPVSALASPAASLPVEAACSVGAVGAPPDVPAVTAAPRTSEWRTQYARAERVLSGLDASASAISAAQNDPNATTGDLATPLTPGEVSQLHLSASVSELVGRIEDRLADGLLTGIYSVFVDPADRRQLDVNMPQPACLAISAITSELPAGSSVRAVAVPGSTYWSESSHDMATINDNIESLQSQGVIIDMMDVNPMTGQLEVHLDPSSSVSASQDLQALIPNDSAAIARDGVQVAVDDMHMNPTAAHVYGGEDLTNDAGDRYCTSNVSTTNGTYYYTLTAAHCFVNNDTAISQNNSDSDPYDYTPAKAIGSPDLNWGRIVYDGAVVKCDCEAIGGIPSDRTAHAEIGNNDNVYDFDRVGKDSTDFSGSPYVCSDGVTSYELYGQIVCGYVSNAQVTVLPGGTLPDGTHYSFTLQDAFEVHWPASDPHPDEGDSGAPVSHLHSLLGMLSGSKVNSDGSVDSYQSKIYHMTDYYSQMTFVGMPVN